MIIADSVFMLISENLLFLLAVFSIINVSFGLSPCDMVDYTTPPSLSNTESFEEFQITITEHLWTQIHVIFLFSFFYLGDREAFLSYKIMLLYRGLRKGQWDILFNQHIFGTS